MGGVCVLEWFGQQVWGVLATTKVGKQLVVKGLLWLFSETNCMARRLSLNHVLSICAPKNYCNNCQRGWVNYHGVLFKSSVGDLDLTSVTESALLWEFSCVPHSAVLTCGIPKGHGWAGGSVQGPHVAMHLPWTLAFCFPGLLPPIMM